MIYKLCALSALLIVNAKSMRNFSNSNIDNWLLDLGNKTTRDDSESLDGKINDDLIACRVKTYNYSDDNTEEKDEGEQFWFESIPIPPIAVATSNSLKNGTCKQQLNYYIDELKKGTLWATQSKL